MYREPYENLEDDDFGHRPSVVRTSFYNMIGEIKRIPAVMLIALAHFLGGAAVFSTGMALVLSLSFGIYFAIAAGILYVFGIITFWKVVILGVCIGLLVGLIRS